MAYTFDGLDRLIVLSTNTTTVDVADMYSRWVDWYLTDDNSKYLPAMRNVGGDPISDVRSLGATFFLMNGWRVRPYEGNHKLSIVGNLFTEPAGESPVVSTLGAFTVVVEYSTSNLIDQVAGSGSALTQLEHDQLFSLPQSVFDSTMVELGATPPAVPTLRQALMLIYMATRNKMTSTGTQLTIHNDEDVAIVKAPTSDDGSVFTREKMSDVV